MLRRRNVFLLFALLSLWAVAPRRAHAQSADAGDLKNTVETKADSLVLFFGEKGGDRGVLYGSAAVTYGDVQLDAGTIEILFDLDEMRAHGTPSDTGMVGRPQFKSGEETFQGDQMAFNMRTERGRVANAETVYDDGHIRGGVVKLTEDSTAYIRNGLYTTCECTEDPSYSLRSRKMKVVDQTKIFTGPIQLFLFNIPTPVWLPFGFLPAQNSRRSGLLAPTYGEDELGFYLRDLGWYFVLSDYMDLQLRGGLWTSGSWQGSSLFRYNRRYRYSGQLQLDFARQRNGEKNDPGFAVRNSSSFRWSHNQTINPSTSLNGDINLTTAGYLRTISEQYDDRVSQTISSSMRFTKRWASTGRSLNLSLSQRQVLDTDAANLRLPSLTFSQNSRKPFASERRAPGTREQWYEKITYTYNFSLDNSFDFRPRSDQQLLAAGDTSALDITWIDALFDIDKYQRATGQDEPFDFKASNRIPISATFSSSKFSLNLTPNFNYTEDWYISTQRRGFELQPDSTQRLVTAAQPGFFALRQFSSGISANTTIYGLFPLHVGAFSGVRHTVRPTLSFTYRPDFGADFWGYTRSYLDQNDNEIEYGIVNGVQQGLQQALSFSLGNTFEAKQVTIDSTGADRSKVVKLFNLDGTASYNFAADSLKMSNIGISGRTSLLNNNLNLNARATYSPYRLNAEGTRVVDEFIFDPKRLKLARLTSLSMTANTSFRSKTGKPGRPLETSRATMAGDRGGFAGNPASRIGASILNPTGDYVDFNIPWTLSMDFTYGIQKQTSNLTRNITLNARFDFSLTPNWKVQGRTGYDFERKEAVTTNISFFRDFECWQMSLSWVPFGRYQSFGFNLQVKSGQLKDFLRIRQPRSDVSGRFDGLLN
ncbi:MAG: putative LPS assembly protein LptD [Rhodothermales bacterium]